MVEETNSPEVIEETEAVEEVTPPQEETPEHITEDTEEVEQETIYADKFKSVSDLEKSYKELQSAFSKKLGSFEGAPEEYELNEEFYEALPETDREIVDFVKEWGKEHQLSNKGLQDLVTSYSEKQAEIEEARIQNEFKKLGKDADIRLKNMEDFLRTNLGEAETEALAANMNDANAIQAIEKLISMTKAPKPAEHGSTREYSVDEVKAMRFATDEHGNRKMQDPAYRKKVLQLEAQYLM